MERTTSREERTAIVVPRRTLIVLCGPAGAGKSTFAHTFVSRHREQDCKATTVVSSDHCRALVCDDETNQAVNRDTFDLFYYIIHKRMFQGRLTIADSTALQVEARRRLLDMALRHQYATCLFVFNMSLETCLAYDQRQSRGRSVGKQVISYHLGLLQQTLVQIPNEGWDQIHVLDEKCSDVLISIAPLAPPGV